MNKNFIHSKTIRYHPRKSPFSYTMYGAFIINT